jgi:hypothetical protein
MKKRSKHWVAKSCVICGHEFESYDKPSAVKRGRQQVTCGNKECANALRSQSLSGKNNPMFGRQAWTKKTHPGVAEKISLSHITGGVNVGARNGMKKPEARAKASASAKRKWATRPDLIENVRTKMVEAWANGDYDGVRVGQCEWHDLTLRDGQVIQLQGSWEYAYAKWMDEQGVTFSTHVGRIPYVDDDGVSHWYYPDFQLEDGTYLDVKSPLYEVKHTRKLELVRQQNDVKIDVLNLERLTTIGLMKHKMPVPEYLPPKMRERRR